MITKNLKLIFLGTPDFAVPFLQALIDNKMRPVLLVSQPDEPVGRKQELKSPPVKVLAQKFSIPLSQPNTKAGLLKILKENQPDVCVLVAYGKIINEEALKIPKFGFVNVHPSLLPKYRGPSPVQTAILNGDKITGATIMLIDQKIDHGPILSQEKIEILPTDNNQTLHNRIAKISAGLLVESLTKYLKGGLEPKPQDDSKATFTKVIQRSDGQVDWSKSAEQINHQFRAFYPWPGIFSHWGRKRLKIADLSVLEGDFSLPAESRREKAGPNLKPGEVFLGQNNSLAVRCGQGAIRLERVQLEGKKEMSGEEFLRGYKNIIGQDLASSV